MTQQKDTSALPEQTQKLQFALNLLHTILQNSSEKIESLFKENPNIFGEETSSVKDESIALLPMDAFYGDSKEDQDKMNQHRKFRDKVFKLAKA